MNAKVLSCIILTLNSLVVQLLIFYSSAFVLLLIKYRVFGITYNIMIAITRPLKERVKKGMKELAAKKGKKEVISKQ